VANQQTQLDLLALLDADGGWRAGAVVALIVCFEM